MFKTKPFRHQLREFELHRDAPARALLWQMRSGKSKASIDLACYLYEQGRVDLVLVLAPNNVHRMWLTEQLGQHHWDSVPRASFLWEARRASNVRFFKEWDEFIASKGLKWFSLNHDALRHPKARELIAKAIRGRRVLLIVDEVHEFRNVGSKRCEALLALARRTAVRRILSGTSTDNSPLHAFAEYEVLAPAALGHETYTSFKGHFAIEADIYVPGGMRRDGTKKAPRKMRAVTGYQNQEELRARIAEWSSLVLRQECDDMPDLIQARHEFQLHPEQVRLYNDLVRNVLVRLDSGEMIEPVEGGVLRIRLQQIASGFAVDADGLIHQVVSPEENPRLQALLSEVALLPGKAVVWCQFREDIRLVVSALRQRGIQSVDYWGGTTPKDRAKNERLFRERDDVKVLVGQPAAGGQGLDFSAASDIIWYSHTSDNIKRRQADERATKVGGRKIGVCDLVASGSVDEKILEDLAGKAERSDFLTGEGLRRYLSLVR